MSIPVFIHIMANGDIWVSNNIQDTPTGTVIGTYRCLDDGKFQKIGTLAGTANSSLTTSGANGKWGASYT